MNIKAKLTALLLLIAVMLIPSTVKAQGNPMLAPLPADTAVRIGQLPNGLTYYIRHNEYPKGQADFYIAQKVGSILEEDNQRGLAHFLEHMCFNGTTHFPGSSLRDWLETVGVKFGVNLNAYTGVDETVYNISNVPVARTSVQDSCLLILHDWANDLLLEPEEIDKERGVIHEEWRRSNVGQMRILERMLPEIYPTSKYGHRLPIGTMEVVDNFPYQTLRDYYETWYRPDQQAVVVVGDIDVDRIEGKIKEMFADIEMPANPKERVYEPVPDHEGTIYSVGSDPEQETLIAQMMFLSDAMPREMRNTPAFLMQNYIESMISSMLNQRLADIAAKPGAPFAGAGASFGEYFLAKTKDAFTISAMANGGSIDSALEAAYREALRAAQGGFTANEYDMARNEFLARWETNYKNRATRENTPYVNEYVRSFIDNDPIPGIEAKYQFYSQIAPMIPVELINQTFAEVLPKDNRVVIALAPEKEGVTVPTREGLKAIVDKVDAETLEAFVEELKSEPLIPALPAPGTIVATDELKQFGATVWTLSNGAKVIFKPTKFKDDEIQFIAYAPDGYQNVGEEYDNTIRFLDEIINENGLGDYSNSDLTKYTKGKNVRLGLSLGNFTRSVEGYTTPKDLPTLMELLYMTFTNYNFTADEFTALQESNSAALAHQEANPQFIFMQKIYSNLFDSERQQPITTDVIGKASREQAISLVHDMMKNAADFTFIFVGNLDEATLRPLVEQYIASLPGDPATAAKPLTKATANPKYLTKAGAATDISSTKMETPQTYVAILESGEIPFTPKNAYVATIAGQVLSNRLLKEVREEMGAVYSIGASAGVDRAELGLNATVQTMFPMKPEMKEQVLAYIAGEFEKMANDVTADEINPHKEYLVKTFTANKEKNGPWLSAIHGYVVNGVDSFNGNIDTVNAITVDDVKAFMKAVNDQDNYRVIVLDPETK